MLALPGLRRRNRVSAGATLRSARSNMSENFLPHVSAKSPSNILSQPENALIRKFYQSQCAKPTKNDWCLTVQSNLETLRLSAFSGHWGLGGDLQWGQNCIYTFFLFLLLFSWVLNLHYLYLMWKK